jgi:hypothetical protein
MKSLKKPSEAAQSSMLESGRPTWDGYGSRDDCQKFANSAESICFEDIHLQATQDLWEKATWSFERIWSLDESAEAQWRRYCCFAGCFGRGSDLDIDG